MLFMAELKTKIPLRGYSARSLSKYRFFLR
jgi:hypothetical protein